MTSPLNSVFHSIFRSPAFFSFLCFFPPLFSPSLKQLIAENNKNIQDLNRKKVYYEKTAEEYRQKFAQTCKSMGIEVCIA